MPERRGEGEKEGEQHDGAEDSNDDVEHRQPKPITSRRHHNQHKQLHGAHLPAQPITARTISFAVCAMTIKS